MNLIFAAAAGLYRMITGPANTLVYLVYIVLHLYARRQYQKMDEQCDVSTRAWQGATIVALCCCEIAGLLLLNTFDPIFYNIIMAIYTYSILFSIVMLLAIVACNDKLEPFSEVPVRHDAPDTCRYLHPEM